MLLPVYSPVQYGYDNDYRVSLLREARGGGGLLPLAPPRVPTTSPVLCALHRLSLASFSIFFIYLRVSYRVLYNNILYCIPVYARTGVRSNRLLRADTSHKQPPRVPPLHQACVGFPLLRCVNPSHVNVNRGLFFFE